MGIVIKAACGCNVGKIRKNNEDNFYFGGRILPQNNSGLRNIYRKKFALDKSPLFAIFDGMGGEEAGEVASFVAAEIAKEYARYFKEHDSDPDELLLKMSDDMNRAVCVEMDNLGGGRMGSTLVALTFTKDQLYTCNLGDSRIYRYRDDNLLQLSQDDIELLPPGVNRKPCLMQHLGIFEDELKLEPHIVNETVKKGDVLLICSDGLTDMVSLVEICSILKDFRSEKRAVKKLIELALEHGGKDNTTVIVCRIK